MTQTVLQSIFFYTALTDVLEIFYEESVKRTFGAMCGVVFGEIIDFMARQQMVA